MQSTKFPKDPRCRFTNIQKQLLAQFVVFADFESIIQRVVDEAMDTTQGVAVCGDEHQRRNPSKSTAHAAFSYKLSSVVPYFSRPLVSYRGEDAGEMFVRKLQEEAKLLFHVYIAYPQQLLAPRQICAPSTLPSTVTCNQPLGGGKVCDHCHIVGTYRGVGQNIKV